MVVLLLAALRRAALLPVSSIMPLRITQYDGEFGLHIPPPGQVKTTNITTLAQLIVFEFPATNLDRFEIYTCVERQWELRKALLAGVRDKLLNAQSSEDVHPEHPPIAAGILQWLYGFEE
jgi:hypothetical protein